MWIFTMIDEAAGAKLTTVATVNAMIKQYLAHPEVVRKNPTAIHFEAAVRVFAGRKCKVLAAAAPSQPSDHASSTQCANQESFDLAALLERLGILRQRLNENKKK